MVWSTCLGSSVAYFGLFLIFPYQRIAYVRTLRLQPSLLISPTHPGSLLCHPRHYACCIVNFLLLLDVVLSFLLLLSRLPLPHFLKSQPRTVPHHVAIYHLRSAPHLLYCFLGLSCGIDIKFFVLEMHGDLPAPFLKVFEYAYLGGEGVSERVGQQRVAGVDGLRGWLD